MEFLAWIPVLQTLGHAGPQTCASPTSNRKSGWLSRTVRHSQPRAQKLHANRAQTYENQVRRGTGQNLMPTSRTATARLACVTASSARRWDRRHRLRSELHRRRDLVSTARSLKESVFRVAARTLAVTDPWGAAATRRRRCAPSAQPARGARAR